MCRKSRLQCNRCSSATVLGVERLAAVLYQIDDIRRLYTSDLRFLRQF
ncbi:MAG: hypothetical protein NW224_01780 [Leptolyngbyaceae cyanobacterium bins.302]|nr:hypothetical protein [Leptolyngbyaceae cyanobacterium bins.302]